MEKPKIVIHWFRRDLRLEDNHALFAALNSGYPVLGIFIFDNNILKHLKPNDARVQFIHNTLLGMHKTLSEVGSSLHIKFGTPEEVFTSLCSMYDINSVYVNRDYEPYAQERDKTMQLWFQSMNISFIGKKDHVIFEKHEVVKDNGAPYTVYTPYSKKWKSILKPSDIEPFPSEKHLSKFYKTNNNNSEIPTLKSMGFDGSNQAIPVRILEQNIIEKYHLQRDIPSILGTTRISIHLRFGTISIRKCAAIGLEKNEKWLNELIWRDFYQMIIFHFPHTVHGSFKPIYDHIQWRNNEIEFERWCQGKTGYPIVDAGMRELNETGFMHNRVRMIVASFLTKHLLIDWRWGERYFAEKLLDFELASNIGGWQWAAGSGCDAAPYFRVFNPKLQTDKFDPTFKYIKQWVPEFGTTAYPAPIVEHTFARNRCLDVYKSALKS
ncbi:MAG: cryptochrome/photolyase family protein [Bacteroidota bacterium]